VLRSLVDGVVCALGMTTIAYREGILAADRLSVQGSTKSRCTKLFKIDGHAIGVAGELACGLLFIEWFSGGMRGDCPLNDQTTALVLNLSTGDCRQWESPGAGILVEDEFAAIGSGAGFAYGAMEMGADARQAVRIASKYDVYTGGSVQVIKAQRG